MVRLGLTVALVLLGLDQLTKWVVLAVLDLPARPIAVTPFFNLVMVWNRGVSFGMLDTLGGVAPWLLSGLALAVVIGLLFWLRRSEHAMMAIGLGLVIGGALGNVIDRLRYGAVVDFLDFHAGRLSLARVQSRRRRHLRRCRPDRGGWLAGAPPPIYIVRHRKAPRSRRRTRDGRRRRLLVRAPS